jgi:hypothetical protein
MSVSKADHRWHCPWASLAAVSTEFAVKLYCKKSGMIDDTISKPHGLKGALMKTLVLLLVVAGLAASPAAAQKKDKQTTEAEEIAKQHDNTRRALRDALPLVLPSWSLPFYFGMHLDDTKNEKKKK